MRKTLLAGGLLLLSNALAFGKKAPEYPVFPEQEYEVFSTEGNSTISGQAFLRTVGGDVKVAAGSDVTLDPVTAYSRIWWESAGSWWAKKNEFPPDKRFRKFRRATQADAEGRFKFSGLAPGNYYVRSVLVWSARGSGPQGGLVVKEVHVEPGQAVEVLVTEVPDRGHWNLWDSSLSLVSGAIQEPSKKQK